MKFVKFSLGTCPRGPNYPLGGGAPISISRWVLAVSETFLFFSLTPGDLPKSDVSAPRTSARQWKMCPPNGVLSRQNVFARINKFKAGYADW